MNDIAAVLGLPGPLPDREFQKIAAALAARFGLDPVAPPPGGIYPNDPLILLHPAGDSCAAWVWAGSGASARWLIAADARLDDRDALVRSLGLDLSSAPAITDAALVGLAFDRWGEAAPQRLLGGFAIVAWDRRERRLHLVADTSAEKFLYFHVEPRRACVATRAPILLATPGVPRAVDVPALVRFYDNLPELWRTPLAGVEAVPPGHAAVIDLAGRCERRRWWTPPATRAWIGRTIDHPVERLREVFRSAVTDRLRSSDPAGGFCSGGLDSTAVTAVASATLAGQGRTYRSYTSIPHPDWNRREPSPLVDDEKPFVRLLAEMHPNLFPTFVAVDGTIFLDCLPVIFQRSAGPVRNTSNAPWFLAVEDLMKADGVRCPLSGSMGNLGISLQCEIVGDLLAAGRIDLLAAEWRAHPAAFWASFRRALAAVLPAAIRCRLGHAGNPPGSQWRRQVALRAEAVPAFGLRRAEAAAGATAVTCAGRKAVSRRTLESAHRLNGLDPAIRHLDPTADRRVLELCWSLPPTEFRHGTVDRRLIRRAMAGWVPDQIRFRRAIGAQAPDAARHLGRRLGDLRDAVEFVARDALCAELIDIPGLRRWLAEWPPDDAKPGLRASIPHLRAVAMGLYIRWVNEDLASLPGARPVSAPILSRG